MKITIDATRCSGHARCADAAPDVFELDESGYVLPITEVVPDERTSAARFGAAACPERAITVE